ncbi:MAG: hypothetical protein A2845_02380 [Candidatus Lloydbacteria bacterium RIFCSPHIGHO2_01_FULL_49_22]|uniref:histidine kinase n=1 Tax=Candidatus Lloydbacteria bacterium RIFCSPHIGHO2_01_FULL_49_22 TaxID=1798658 RepID=A0A1G2CUU9_9BACT|nr:MAG: hypothetical protein A2845_02380 [Candidatus Lloydbacteria bacterium RIFCSPHIGHO2_01_FULL_49_22]OGZ10295.1 MAG: hypothetical protein A3C14_02080 [Candidatus Lloydbacteria bacterium RIFCSPHIGHO2_02_FULL_50_18]
MLSLTIAIIILNLSLGLAILVQSKRGVDAGVFFLITLAFSALTIANYLSLTTDPNVALYWVRAEMFIAAWHTFLFFVFVHAFAKSHFEYSLKHSLIFTVPFIIILVISVSPYLFSAVALNKNGLVETIPGNLFPVFALWLLGTMFLSMRRVVINFRSSTGTLRSQWKYLLIGSCSTYLLLIIFNFILGGFLQNTRFLAYTPIFSLPILFATAYAIVKHNLFDIKVLATQAFVTIISIFYLVRIVVATTMTDRVIGGVIFVTTVFFGFLLIRSVKEEIRAREKIALMAKSLTDTNWELAKSNEQLRIIDKRKSEFVSIVSHQLRTPITAMKGYSSLLLEDSYGPITDAVRAPIEKIFVSSKRLAEMVTDFLNISKIEQGTMTYTLTPVDVGTMITDLTEEFIPVARLKNIRLQADVPTSEKFIVNADDGKLRQVLSNLIDNSIKYTPQGGVDISVETLLERDLILIKIKDTGIGLSQEDIHHLFGKFTRGSEGQRHNTDGSGLGLYVAKKMLEAQGGNVWVDSEGPGKGSTFIIELHKEGEN